jgi:hypothetical protein
MFLRIATLKCYMTIFSILSFSNRWTGHVDLIEEESWMNPKKNAWRKMIILDQHSRKEKSWVFFKLIKLYKITSGCE